MVEKGPLGITRSTHSSETKEEGGGRGEGRYEVRLQGGGRGERAERDQWENTRKRRSIPGAEERM